MIDATAATITFHEFDLAVSCDDAVVLDAIKRRFAADGRTGDDAARSVLRVDVRTAEAAAVPRPAGDGRLVYESARGRAYWNDAEERLELAAEHGYAECRPADGTAEIVVVAAAPDAVWTATRPLLTLTAAELLKAHGLYFLHVGAVEVARGALLLPGTSGAGKSTLAVALARAGYPFLGDDAVFLEHADGGVRVRRFADEIDLSARSVELLRISTPPRGRLAGTEKAQFGADDLGLTLGADATAPSAIVFPELTAGPAELRPITLDEALVELLPNVLMTATRTVDEHVALLAELAAAAPAYRLAVPHDLAAAVRLVEQTFDAEPGSG